ncbi:MAG: hypothetical protein KDD60_08640, partial [Bdellovibrionales bacterium]|nr:hypothetical protein [Bdellovibrionales bacterium]
VSKNSEKSSPAPDEAGIVTTSYGLGMRRYNWSREIVMGLMRVLFILALYCAASVTCWAIEPSPSPSSFPSPSPTGIDEDELPTPTPYSEDLTIFDELQKKIERGETVGALFQALDTELATLPLEDRRDGWITVKDIFVRKVIHQFPAAEAISGLQNYLRSDKNTQIMPRFALTEDHPVASPASSRAIALSLLGNLDISKAIESERDGYIGGIERPEEAALMIRNVALAAPSENQRVVMNRFLELLASQKLQTEENSALLESFDAVVYARATDEIERLFRMSSSRAHKALSWAAHLAIFRLVETAPVESARELLKTIPLSTEYPEGRASIFSILDISEPEQERAVLTYLKDTNVTESERRVFSERYPSFDGFDTVNLFLTTALPPPSSRPVTGDDIKAFCVKALSVVQRWQRENLLPSRREEINDMTKNLRECSGSSLPVPSSSPRASGMP